jgi:hypothetical protein
VFKISDEEHETHHFGFGDCPAFFDRLFFEQEDP